MVTPDGVPHGASLREGATPRPLPPLPGLASSLLRDVLASLLRVVTVTGLGAERVVGRTRPLVCP